MAISIDWTTRTIYVPQAYLTDLGGGNYGLDVDQFRLDLKDIEDSAEGMPFLDTHRHSTEVVLSGVTYARFVEIINGYTVEFEDGNYAVVCVGANHNLADVKALNSVSLIVGNSAGLIVSGSGVTEQDKQDIADSIWDETLADHVSADTFGEAMNFVFAVDAGRWKIVNSQMVFYKEDNVTEIARFDLLDRDGEPADGDIFERVRA